MLQPENHQKWKNTAIWKNTAAGLVIVLMALFLFRTAVLDRVPKESRLYTEEYDFSAGETVSFRHLTQILPRDPERLRGIAFAFARVPSEGFLQVKVYDGDLMIYGGRIDFYSAVTDDYSSLYLNLPPAADKVRHMELEVQDTDQSASVYVKNADKSAAGLLPLSADGKEAAGKQLLCAYEYHPALSSGQKARYIVPRLLLFILVLAAILNSERILHITDRFIFLRPYRLLRTYCNTPEKGILFVLFCAYSGFAAAGSNTLILPLEAFVTVKKLLVFTAAFLLAIPVNTAVLYLFHLYILHSQAGEDRMPKRRFAAVILSLIVLPAIITLIAYNPLISSNDTMTAVHDARNLSEASGDWVPVVYTLMIRGGLNILDNVCVIAIEQLLFWGFVITRILLYAREKGVRDGILFGFALFIGCNPANVLHINSGWKDIPYACSLLWVVFNLIRLTVDEKKYAGRLSFYAAFAVSLALTYLSRKNGAAPFLTVITILLLFFRGYRKRFAAILLSILLIFIVEVPVCRILNIGLSPMYTDQRAYSAFAVDSVGMYLAEAEMNEKALNFVAQSTGKYNNNKYQPTYYNFWSLSHFDSRVEAKDFIAFAGDTIIRNPVKYLRVSLARNDLLWNILPGDGRIISLKNYRSEVTNPQWQELAALRKPNILTGLFDGFYTYTEKSDIYEALFYRCGLYSWLCLLTLLLFVFAGKKRSGMLIHAPLLSQILGLWFTSGYGGEFRFYWPLNTICLVYIMMLPVLCRKLPDLSPTVPGTVDHPEFISKS